MKKYLFLGLLALVLVGAGCQKPETTTFTNNSSTDEQTSMNQDIPKSDKAGVKITVTPPANLLKEAVNTNSSSKAGPIVIMKTTLGDITIQLFEEATPKTVESFVTLAKQDYFNGIIFHRVIPGFMIQGGDPLTREQRDNRAIHGTGGPGYKFADEFNNHKNVRGSLSMANAGPGTNGSQFFINTADNSMLDGKHAVFGEVTSGMDVVEKIASVARDSRDHPLEDVEILDLVF